MIKNKNYFIKKYLEYDNILEVYKYNIDNLESLYSSILEGTFNFPIRTEDTKLEFKNYDCPHNFFQQTYSYSYQKILFSVNDNNTELLHSILDYQVPYYIKLKYILKDIGLDIDDYKKLLLFYNNFSEDRNIINHFINNDVIDENNNSENGLSIIKVYYIKTILSSIINQYFQNILNLIYNKINISKYNTQISFLNDVDISDDILKYIINNLLNLNDISHINYNKLKECIINIPKFEFKFYSEDMFLLSVKEAYSKMSSYIVSTIENLDIYDDLYYIENEFYYNIIEQFKYDELDDISKLNVISYQFKDSPLLFLNSILYIWSKYFTRITSNNKNYISLTNIDYNFNDIESILLNININRCIKNSKSIENQLLINFNKYFNTLFDSEYFNRYLFEIFIPLFDNELMNISPSSINILYNNISKIKDFFILFYTKKSKDIYNPDINNFYLDISNIQYSNIIPNNIQHIISYSKKTFIENNKKDISNLFYIIFGCNFINSILLKYKVN